MRKNLAITIITCLIAAMLLSGCAASKSITDILTEKTDELFQSLQKFDTENMTNLTQEAESNSQTDQSAEATTESEDDLMTKSLEGYFTDCASKMTYEIRSVDEENLTVDLTCTYVDSQEFVRNFYMSAFAAAFNHLDGSDITDEEMQKIVDDSIAAVTEEKTVTKDIHLVYEEKDGDYVLTEVPDEVIDAGTAGFYGYMNQIDQAMNEDEESSAE